MVERQVTKECMPFVVECSAYVPLHFPIERTSSFSDRIRAPAIGGESRVGGALNRGCALVNDDNLGRLLALTAIPGSENLAG